MPLVAIMIDGVVVGGQSVLVAWGVSESGEKQPIGVHLGTTENAAVVQGLLDNLIGRGLDPMTPRLFVIDGGKALRKAIKDTFGRRALVQRCQVHKGCAMCWSICRDRSSETSGPRCATPTGVRTRRQLVSAFSNLCVISKLNIPTRRTSSPMPVL